MHLIIKGESPVNDASEIWLAAQHQLFYFEIKLYKLINIYAPDNLNIVTLLFHCDSRVYIRYLLVSALIEAIWCLQWI